MLPKLDVSALPRYTIRAGHEIRHTRFAGEAKFWYDAFGGAEQGATITRQINGNSPGKVDPGSLTVGYCIEAEREKNREKNREKRRKKREQMTVWHYYRLMVQVRERGWRSSKPRYQRFKLEDGTVVRIGEPIKRTDAFRAAEANNARAVMHHEKPQPQTLMPG